MNLYTLVKTYIKLALALFYKDISVSGKDHLPKDQSIPLLFVANHQNAMMDPVLVATAIKEPMYFLARASAFKNKIASKLLRTIHAIAIYRVRDGVNSKKLNEAVFSECLSLFNKGQNILIFPEGSHSTKRQIRSLRAGFTRMIIDFIKANPNKKIRIIPIGLNYNNTENYAKKVHIVIGEPIDPTLFFYTDALKTKRHLIEEVSKQLKKVTVHIDDANYKEIHDSLNEQDFLLPNETNQKIKKSNIEKRIVKKKSNHIFYYLMMINSAFPFLIWHWMQSKIKEREFISTAKFSLGITVFPLFYFLQTALVNAYFGGVIAISYLVLTIVLVFISTKTR